MVREKGDEWEEKAAAEAMTTRIGGSYCCRLSSQAESFSRALKRCEILFFSALSISAYVFPSYSKIGSQPYVARSAVSQSSRKRTFRTEPRRPSRMHDLPLFLVSEETRCYLLGRGKGGGGVFSGSLGGSVEKKRAERGLAQGANTAVLP